LESLKLIVRKSELINGAQPVGRQVVAEFVGRYGRVWYW